MKKHIYSSLILINFIFCVIAQAQNAKIVTGQQVNGTWQNGTNKIKILALGNKKLKVQFNLESAGNVGFVIGTAIIEGISAEFKNEYGCSITLKFKDGKLIVTQNSYMECEFGNHVVADGTYKKISKQKPTFDPE